MAAPYRMWKSIAQRDLKLMRRVHRWPAPRWVQLWMIASTRAGDCWLYVVAGVAVLLFGGEERWPVFRDGTVAVLSSVALFLCLKRLTGRSRPCHIEPHCWSTLLPPDHFSFPSGHTMVAFAVTTMLYHFYPFLWPCLLFCAMSVAASRVVLGMHFLSDVGVGATVGIWVGYASVAAFADSASRL